MMIIYGVIPPQFTIQPCKFLQDSVTLDSSSSSTMALPQNILIVGGGVFGR